MIDHDSIRSHIALSIFLERVAQRYTRQELADAIDVNINTMKKIEKGEQKINLEMYLEICSFFSKGNKKVGISYFLPDEWNKIRKG